MIKRMLSVLPILLPFIAAAQFTIKGRIINEQTGAHLIGAHISINNNLRVAITKQEGLFEIKDLPIGDYNMKVTYLGYADWTSVINLQDNQTMLISMEETTYQMNEEIIIHSTRAGNKVPVASFTLSQEDIDRNNQGRDVPFLLEKLPSVITTSDAGTGIGYSSFRIRGTDMNRINITLNGIPLNDAESHSVFWVNMPDIASSVSSLQVQRGVGTSTNGAAAFGASVNMQTSIPPQQAYAELNNAFGSFNTWQHSLSAGTGMVNNHWSIDTRLSKMSSDGFIDRASADLRSFYVSAGYYGKNTILKLNTFSGLEKTYQAWYGIPSDILANNRTYNGMGFYIDKQGQEHYYEDQTDNYQQDHYQILLSQKLTNKANLNLGLHLTNGRGYYEQYEDDDDLADYGIQPQMYIANGDTVDFGISDLIRQKHLDNQFYGFTLSYNYQPNNRLKLNFGSSGNIYNGDHFGRIIWAEYADNIGHNYEWYRGAGDKKDLNLYAKTNFQATGRLSLYGDIQARTIDYKITGIDDDLRDISQSHSFLFFNPKTGVYLDIHSNGSIYASFAIAHREPNRDNYTDVAPGSNAPVAEKLYDYEAGYHYQTSKMLFNANLYYMNYRDQLILTGDINDVGSPIMINIDKSYRTGLELSGTYQFTEALMFSANATYSENKIKQFTEKVPDYDLDGVLATELNNTNIAFSPSTIAGAELSWTIFKGASVSWDAKYVSRQFIDNTSNKSRSLDPYLVNNLKLYYSLKPKFGREVLLTVYVNNLFNEKYETNAWVSRYYYKNYYGEYNGYFPQAGINFHFGTTIKL